MEEKFFLIKDGYYKRRWWDNVFCNTCGKELSPDESFGDSSVGFGICDECSKILFSDLRNRGYVII